MEPQTGTEMHASGFGSPPPGGGGFGPPPGGGGGFGPPPGGGGGFGPPPGGGGGFGPPPGGGGGFGPPPGGGGGFGPPPGAGGGYGEPPKKKSNTLMFVGIGCGALLFLSCVCGGGIYWWTARKAQEAMDALQQYQPTPGTFGAVPSGDSAGSGAAPAGGDTCAKVDRCCPAFYVARGLGSEQAATTCAQMASARSQAMGGMLETVCAAQLQAFTSAGGGIPLPPECQ